jgi:hypothetical protein
MESFGIIKDGDEFPPSGLGKTMIDNKTPAVVEGGCEVSAS